MSLVANNVSVVRSGRDIVTDVSVSIEPGTTTALIGPNGAGKSTLLKVLAGEFLPDRGDVHIDGKNLPDLSAEALARRRTVMAQSTPIVFDFTVEEILGFGWVQDNLRLRSERDSAIEEVSSDCEIQHLLKRTYNTLSGGEKQRAQLARCLLQIWRPADSLETRYLLLDEPTSALDFAHVVAAMDTTQRQAQQNTGVMMIVHDLNLAARFADRVIVIDGGKIFANGAAAEVLDSDLLSEVYRTPIRVEWHDALQRLVVFS